MERTPSAPTSRSPRRFVPIRQESGDAIVILLEAGKGNPAPHPVLREGVAQERVEPGPGRAELRHRDLGGDAAVAGKRGPPADGDADGAVDAGAGGKQPLQHRRMHAEPGAAPGEPPLGPLEDDHIPARPMQHARREQPAEGPADYDRAPHAMFTCQERFVSCCRGCPLGHGCRKQPPHGSFATALREFLPPHGEVLAAHWPGRRFSDRVRRAANHAQRSRKLPLAREEPTRRTSRSGELPRRCAWFEARPLRANCVTMRLMRGRAPHHEGADASVRSA